MIVSNQYEKRLLKLHQQLGSLSEDGDVKARIKVLGQIASIYEKIEDHAEAIAWLLKLFEVTSAHGYHSRAYTTAMTLGRLHLENQLYGHAFQHYEAAEGLASTERKRVAAQLSMASTLNWEWKTQEAEELLLLVLGKKSLKYELRMRGMILLAAVYDNQRKGTEAQEIYKRCVAEMSGLEIFWQADILKSQAISYCNTEQFDKAVESLHRSEKILNDHTNRHHWKMVYYALSVSYEELGNYAEALKYHKLFRETEKAISEDKVNNKLMAIQVNNKMIQVQHEREMLHNRAIELAEKNSIIEEERNKSEDLLLNILPSGVASELKEHGKVEARFHEEVTVLFTDFKGFTAMAELLSAKELVEDLNICFSEFDRIMEKHGIEKIKTIGDAYMAAGGLPTPNATHATDVVKAALEMRDFVEAGKARKMQKGLPFFEVRVGVHTGPVVAGIVGIKKFAYDIWGDTVNTASRMESSGEAGKVNISETTYELVKDQFACEYRGEVVAKGKGMMKMYFVESASV